MIATKTKKTRKTNFIRLTISPTLEKDLVKARKKYPYLEDAEIIKIWLGNGAKSDFGNLSDEPNNQDLLKHTSKMFQLGEDWQDEEDVIDYSKAKPVSWAKNSSTN